MGGVAENVCGWHGGSRELVDEDGLDLALDEMREHHPEKPGLDIAQWLEGVLAKDSSWVDVWTEWTGEECDEEDWSGVLNEVDCAPGDLWAKILDVDGGGGGDTLGVKEESSAVLDDGLVLWVDDGESVVIAGFGGASKDLLGILNGGDGSDLNGGWEVADWLFASYRRELAIRILDAEICHFHMRLSLRSSSSKVSRSSAQYQNKGL